MVRKLPRWKDMPPELVAYLEKRGLVDSGPKPIKPASTRTEYIKHLNDFRNIMAIRDGIEERLTKNKKRSAVKGSLLDDFDDMLGKMMPDKSEEFFHAELALMDLLGHDGKLKEVCHPEFKGFGQKDVDAYHSLLRFSERASKKAADHAVRLIKRKKEPLKR